MLNLLIFYSQYYDYLKYDSIFNKFFFKFTLLKILRIKKLELNKMYNSEKICVLTGFGT